VTRLLCAIAATAACTATTVGLGAQTPAPPGPQADPTGSRRFVVIGCVSRETESSTTTGRGAAAGPRFIITDTRSDPPSIYRLDGDDATLGFHVGHTVEIAGLLSAGSGGGADPGLAAPVRKGLKVASLTYIATTCRPLT
jgi:hypothetical protein